MSKITCTDYILDDVATWGYHGVIDSLIELLLEDKLEALKQHNTAKAVHIETACGLLRQAKDNLLPKE